MPHLRPATQADLASIYEVFYRNEILDCSHPPDKGDIPAYLAHVLETGTLSVMEQDGIVLAFAGAITRASITFLTDLFVLPSHQSSQLGKTLLHTVLPQDGLIHCTMSSSDRRALALYIRAGMVPQWPHFSLLLEKPTHHSFTPIDIEIIQADPLDPEFLDFDAATCGRLRPADHQFWLHHEQAVPLWFRRHQSPIGYGYVRLEAGTLWHPHAAKIGPLGTTTPQDAIACVLSAAKWALQYSDVLLIEVPGPHPALAPLLESGFCITNMDTFVSNTQTPFFDARCSIASGGDLF